MSTTSRRFSVLALPLLVLPVGVTAQVKIDDMYTNNLFITSGFVVKRGNTPAKEAALRRLPQEKLVVRRKAGKPYYIYADAAGCNCAYVGTAAAYNTYQQGGPGYQYRDINATGKPNIAQDVMRWQTQDDDDGDSDDPDLRDNLLDELNDNW